MIELEFQRVYAGKVIRLHHEYTSPMGNRVYSVWFKGMKKCYYEIHQKQTLPISIGCSIRFTGHFVKDNFLITDVLDSTYMKPELDFTKRRRDKPTRLKRQ